MISASRYRGSTGLLSLALFCTAIFLSVATVDWIVGGVPVRSILVVAALTLIILTAPMQIRDMILANAKTYGLITALALIGLIVSLFNTADLSSIGRQLVEIHLQAVINFTLTVLLARYFGVRMILAVFVAVWSMSAVTALGQFLGVETAWQLRGLLGVLMDDPEITRAFYAEQKRALGLSFTPVHLATQTCLVFAAYFAYRIHITGGRALKEIDLASLAGVIIAMAVCVISGNRSPLAGLAIFTAIYLVIAAPRLIVIAFPFLLVGAVAGFAMFEMLGDGGLRVANLTDGSAVGRSTLNAFGVHLFTENPTGYGLLFDSRLLSETYMHQAMRRPNADVIRHFTLHNYYLQVLNKYGVAIVMLIPLLIPRTRPAMLAWFAFLPYLAHIFFHNDGPLSSDFLFWFVLPLVMAASTNASSFNNNAGRYARRDRQQIPASQL